MLPIISIDFVKSFGQHGVNNQLVTAPVLRRRLSLSSLTFAFHYISQHLETQQHQHRPSSFSPHHHSLAYTSPLLEVNTPRQVMERITCSPIILLKHLASGQIKKKIFRPRTSRAAKHFYPAYLNQSSIPCCSNIVENLLSFLRSSPSLKNGSIRLQPETRYRSLVGAEEHTTNKGKVG